VETPREASHDAFTRRPPPTPAPSRAGSLRATHQKRHYLEQQITARLGILILSKTYPSVITTSPTLNMIGFLATGVSFAEKQQRICPYFQDFSTSSSWLLFSMLAIYCNISCAIQLIKHNIHQLPSLGTSWPVE
jgi:hypothetical protein